MWPQLPRLLGERGVVDDVSVFVVVLAVGAIEEVGVDEPAPKDERLCVVARQVGGHLHEVVTGLVRVLEGQGAATTVVADVEAAIDHAREDDQIAGIYLNLSSFSGAGLDKLDRIGRAIDRFRAADKPVIAWAESYSQGAYYLASYADELYLHPLGEVSLQGFQGYRLSYMERRIYYAHESIDRIIGVENIPQSLRAVPVLDAYRERARIDVFAGETYTPPSFGAGAIFVRDTRQLAAVRVQPGAAPAPVLLPWATLPLALILVRRVVRERGAALNEVLAGTARLELAFALLFAAGWLL